jgi:hypothetical protein
MDWDAAVSAAYLRGLGQTQKDSAECAGIGIRTLQTWEHSPWWKEVQAEAHSRWLNGIVGKTKKAINDALDPHTQATNPFTGELVVDDDGKPVKVGNDPRIRTDAAKYVADRMIAELAPPKQRIAHTAQVNPVDLAKLSDEELAQYHALMEKASDV